MRLLISSDIHGFVMPYRYSDLKPCDHGFLKIRSTMEKYRTADTIVIDNGDLLEGSPLLKYYHLFEESDPDPMHLCVDRFVDLINVGNHDFAFGPEPLLRFLKETDAQCICGNILYEGVPIGSPAIRVLNGKRIAFTSNRKSPQSNNNANLPTSEDNTDIWIMDADGSNLTQLTFSQAIDDMPAWAPDGKSIYFRSNRDLHWGIWKIQIP